MEVLRGLAEASCNTLDAGCFSCGDVDIDDRAVDTDRSFCDGEDGGHRSEKPLDDGRGFAAQTSLGGTAHPGVGKECCSTDKNLFVSGLRVSVRADNGGHAPVQEAGHRNFFARGFGVDIDEDDRGLLTHPVHFGIHRDERVLEGRLCEGPSLNIDHSDLALGCFEDDRTKAGGARGIIERPQETGLGGEVRDDILLVPDVVASRDHGSACAEEVDGQLWGDPASCSRVLAVDDDEVDAFLFTKTGERAGDGVATGLTDVGINLSGLTFALRARPVKAWCPCFYYEDINSVLVGRRRLGGVFVG